ncbi:MAG: hypothetical protein QG640_293 [Patescibacteria group bacterium]|nr:hypothetical protein [Patescibacteria group bacterium]
MYFILFLVILVAFIHQNNRIGKLEESIKKSGKVAVKSTEQPLQAAPAAPAVSSSPVLTQAIPAANSVKSDISSEEVSGRILGRIGIAAVIIGVAFFLKYAFDNNWVGPEGRVAIGILIGIAVMGMGQYLRKKYLQYSDLLMGGGLAILYVSVFSSYALYHLVDPMFAFMGMIVVTAIGVFLSIANATVVLSYIAFIGAFLSPVLIGVTNLGEFITFTYITILNAGILGILLYKRWTNLILCGLVGTWFIFGTWMVALYTNEMLIPTLLFVLVQFLIFTASSVFRIIVEKAKAVEIDYFVMTTTALSFALVCYQILMPEYKHYVSLGSVLVAGFYILIALIAYKENSSDRTLNVFLPGLAVSFLTVAVPIEFSGPWIAAWWFVEAVVLYILASSSSSRGFQIMGVIVYICGLFDLFYYLITFRKTAEFVVFFNGPFVMIMMAVVVAYAIAFMYYRYGSASTEIQQRGLSVFVLMANILTLYAFTTQITAYYELQQIGDITNTQIRNWSNTSVSVLWALYAAMLTSVGFAKRFVTVRYMGLTLFMITAFKVVVDIWSLGEIYRIISFIVFGIIALSASFVYVKYRDRLKGIDNTSNQ